MSWRDDALWLGPEIVTRLSDQVPAFRQVTLMDDLPADASGPHQDPAALVLLDQVSPAGTPSNADVTLTEQTWLVVLAVRSARSDRDRTRALLGPLISATVRAMQGWVPPGQRRPFAWVYGPRPDWRTGLTLFPLAFRAAMVTSA